MDKKEIRGIEIYNMLFGIGTSEATLPRNIVLERIKGLHRKGSITLDESILAAYICGHISKD